MPRGSKNGFGISHLVISAAALLLAVVLGYAIYMVVVSNRAALITATVEYASVDDGIAADGVIIRDEELIFKQPGRVYAPVLVSGERVSAGNSIAMSFSSQANLAQYRALTDAKNRLKLYEELAQTEETPSALPAMNHAIFNALRTCAAFSDGGLYTTEASNAFASLESAVLKRDLALAGDIDLSGTISELKATISELDAALANDMQSLTTELAGYYVQTADGYEQLLTVASIDDMTVASLRDKLEFPASAISSDTVLGKIVRGYTWYTAMILTGDEARLLSDGKTYPMTVAGDRVETQIVKMETDGDSGAVLVVFRCDVPLSDMASEREQKCTVILGSYSGFKIPLDGLRVLDGKPGVFVLEGAKAVFKPVEILFTGDSYYIVEANSTDTNQLFLYDEIILGRNDLYDGKIVK